MVDLGFAVEGARAEPYAASPLLMLALRLTNQTPAFPVLNVMLNCQIRIEPAQRSYAMPEQESSGGIIWRASAMGANPSQLSMDARELVGPGIRAGMCHRSPGAL